MLVCVRDVGHFVVCKEFLQKIFSSFQANELDLNKYPQFKDEPFFSCNSQDKNCNKFSFTGIEKLI